MNAEARSSRAVSKAARRFRCASMVNSLARNWQNWATEHTDRQKTQPVGWQPSSSAEEDNAKSCPCVTEMQTAGQPQPKPKSSSSGEGVVSVKEPMAPQETGVSIRTLPVVKTVGGRKSAKSNELVTMMTGRFNQPALEQAPKPFLGDRSPTRRRLRLSNASGSVGSWATAEREGKEPTATGREKRKEGDEEECVGEDGGDDRGKRKKLVRKIHVRTMGDLKSTWLQWAEDHIEKQKLNPFSEDFDYDYAMTFRLKKGDQGYGRPKEGSKSAERGERAQKHVRREIDELCYIISDMGARGKDGKTIVSFGRLFDRYVTISDKVVGILMRARKHGLVDFPGEMLWQGQDDHVLITLLD